MQILLLQPTITEEEQRERDGLQNNLAGGFCFAGNLSHDRTPAAVEILYGPLDAAPSTRALSFGETGFWGVQNFMGRILIGIDPGLYNAILCSGRWLGTPADLASLVNLGRLNLPGILPLRDAIDWVYSSIFSTIKALKFSQMAPICGGPVEIAVVTTDRPFRWVCHKGLDTAIAHRMFSDAHPHAYPR